MVLAEMVLAVRRTEVMGLPWRLFTFDKTGLENGFRAKSPRWFKVQVWAHRTR